LQFFISFDQMAPHPPPETAGGWMLKLDETAFLLEVNIPFANCLHTTPHGITTTTATTITSS
jgi:hypothetical protein